MSLPIPNVELDLAKTNITIVSPHFLLLPFRGTLALENCVLPQEAQETCWHFDRFQYHDVMLATFYQSIALVNLAKHVKILIDFLVFIIHHVHKPTQTLVAYILLSNSQISP